MTSVDAGGIEALRSDMSARRLTPLWELEAEIMGVTPNPRTEAWLWRWQDVYDVAQRAGALVPVERGGDRRAIALSNPGQDGLPYATSTLWAAVQWLNGHEVAPAHRHTSSAIRFIIDGAGSYSTVEGERIFLERGDLVLTPQWLWHDHGSQSDERAVWMDVLDIPLNNYLDASFFEPYPEESQAVTEQVERSAMAFKWADTERALHAAPVDPFDGAVHEFGTPDPVMPSFGCRMQLLQPDAHTQAHRHTGSAVYLAFEGRGATIVDGTRFEWQAGDMFVVGSWAAHEHVNADAGAQALLFCAHDAPLLRMLDKYREEPLDQQTVTGEFA